MTYPDFDAQWRNPTVGRRRQSVGHQQAHGARGRRRRSRRNTRRSSRRACAIRPRAGRATAWARPACLRACRKVMNFSEPMEIIVRPDTTYFVPLHYPTPPHLHRWARLARRRAAELRRLFDRPMDRSGRRRPLRRARGRDPQFQGSARFRIHRPAAARGQPDHRQGAHLSRQGRSGRPARRDHHHRSCVDPSLDGRPDLSARAEPRAGWRRAATRPTAMSSSARSSISSAPTAS